MKDGSACRDRGNRYALQVTADYVTKLAQTGGGQIPEGMSFISKWTGNWGLHVNHNKVHHLMKIQGLDPGQAPHWQSLWSLYGSHGKAREAGRVRIEGKEYVMQDGDVVDFRFNV